MKVNARPVGDAREWYSRMSVFFNMCFSFMLERVAIVLSSNGII